MCAYSYIHAWNSQKHTGCPTKTVQTTKQSKQCVLHKNACNKKPTTYQLVRTLLVGPKCWPRCKGIGIGFLAQPTASHNKLKHRTVLVTATASQACFHMAKIIVAQKCCPLLLRAIVHVCRWCIRLRNTRYTCCMSPTTTTHQWSMSCHLFQRARGWILWIHENDNIAVPVTTSSELEGCKKASKKQTSCLFK